MKSVIYKYDLAVTDRQTVEMPSNAEIMCVQVQNGKPRLWALVEDPQSEFQTTDTRSFITIGTGHIFQEPDDKCFSYIGTYQLHEGELVFHVFEGEYE